MLPMSRHNGQAVAQGGAEVKSPLFSVTCRGMITVMERGVVAHRSCNSVFRYPSPSGWSCVVPSGSPVFSMALASQDETGDIAGTKAERAGTRPVKIPIRERGTGTCVSQQHSLFLHSSGFRPVVTLLVSRRSSGRAQAPWQRQRLAATWRPVRSWAARPTLFIAKNSPSVADRRRGHQSDLMLPAALRLDLKPKPSTCASATVAFLLPVSAGSLAGQDQEGR